MQDFSHLYDFVSSVPVRSWEEILGDLKEEDFVSSPEKMYMLSMRIHDRLPDRLHESMLMWSFDPKQSDYVKMYLNWVGHCDEMKASRERTQRMLRNHDRTLFCMMLVSGVALASILFYEFLK